ncbi:MAG: hypothetical protein JNM80_04100 [Phycisphaerae bacterium]|nr:hypothetical protein [Phycisphaerae bacterium]
MPKPTVEERLAQLEKQVSDLRARVVEASEFRLVDAAGNVRGALSLTRHGPALVLFDDRGQPRAELLAGAEGPGLTFADPKGLSRLWLGVTKDAPRLGMADAKGKSRAHLTVEKKGAALRFYDPGQGTAWSAP